MVHKNAASASRSLAPVRRRPGSHLSATHVSRPAMAGEAGEIQALLAPYVAQGLLLPRTTAEILEQMGNFVVVVDGRDRVRGCAVLTEYSPSLAEVGAVAVAGDAQGQGLGSLAVRGAEGLARRRGFAEVFAMSRADRFFESLGYERTSIDRFPEKLARYEALASRGIVVTAKRCYRKSLG